MVNQIKREMRKLLDHINDGYNNTTPKKKLNESRIVMEADNDFTDALRQKIVNDDDYKNGDVHQAILNVAYDDWQNNDKMQGYRDMIEHTHVTYGPLAAFAVLAGKHNQQVENGGHAQYFDNGYAGGDGPGGRKDESDTELHQMLIEFANQYNISSLSGGSDALEIYNEWKPSQSDCDECGGNGHYEEDCPDCHGQGMDDEGETCEYCDGSGVDQGECSQCWGSGEGEVTGEADYLDSAWYKLNGPYMKALNSFFASKLKSNTTEESFNHVEETATSGGSSAGGIASVPGSLGAGFGGDPKASIYHKKEKKNRKKPTIIKR